MPDFDAILTATAARFAAAQVTPPAGYQNIRLATADLPNDMGPLPCVFVIPVSGDFTAGAGDRLGVHDLVARFYYSQTADLPRDLPALRRWLTVLADQLRLSAQLGGTVAYARVVSWKAGIMLYGGQEYSGLELGLRIGTSEGWAATS